MHVNYTILILDSSAPYSAIFQRAVAARAVLSGRASTAQIASLLEHGYFFIADAESLEIDDVPPEGILDPATEIEALADIQDLRHPAIYVNRSTGAMYLTNASCQWARAIAVGNIISALASGSLHPPAANDQTLGPPVDEGTRNIASYIIGHAVPSLENQAQECVLLGQPVEVSRSEMVTMLLMSVALAFHQRTEIENGTIRSDQAIMPSDVLRCIRIAKPLSVAS
ncbi:hypothetical protein [Microvirga massiliensis]|uniref:hypothetical protein n=1 Tax=Microvirga massiliensis TaxID=1033741 RepID=UPI00062B69EA|nr:hypothetical protein [Microvirga massiliensis]